MGIRGTASSQAALLTVLTVLGAGACASQTEPSAASSTSASSVSAHDGHDGHAAQTTTATTTTTASTKATPTTPSIVNECEPHPLTKPGKPGTLMCNKIFGVQVVKVEYDTKDPVADRAWKAQNPEDPVWILVDFTVHRFTEAPGLSTNQTLPTLTDVRGIMGRVGQPFKKESIPGNGSVTYRAVYVHERGEVKRADILFCNAFLSSPEKSQGCSHI